MKELLAALDINLILRSLFAGLLFRMAKSNALEIDRWGGDSLINSVLIGILLYVVYRSSIYPLMEWFWNSSTGQAIRADAPMISENTTSELLKRWRKLKRTQKHLEVWADFTHLQFAAAIAILLGRTFSNGDGCCIWIGLACLLFIAGLISDWRLRSVMDQYWKEEEKAVATNKSQAGPSL